MFKKIVSKSRSTLGKVKETLKAIGLGVVIAIGNMPTSVYATDAYLKPLINLKVIFISIIASAGVIVLGYGGVKFGISFKKMDQNGEHDAVFTMICGGIFIGISAIIAALTA